MGGKKKVLIAPLNWGLGHASRCIPIIQEYLDKDWEVIIASDGPALIMLQKTFPNLESHELPGYNITYAKDAGIFKSVLKQMPKLWLRIKEENRWLREYIKEAPVDLIISDNRYGLYSKSSHSIIITHQLYIKAPFFDEMLNKYNKRLLSRFDECWIPDTEGDENISGELSKAEISIPKKFIGPLSSLKKNEGLPFDIPLLCVLSGPEPQRTLLERELKPFLTDYPGSYLIRGMMEDNSRVTEDGLNIQGHASRQEVEDLMNRSRLVICRSGYSSLMDLLALEKKAILIPTPGQTEQEYLAERHSNRLQFRSIKQDEVSEGLRNLINSSETWGLS